MFFYSKINVFIIYAYNHVAYGLASAYSVRALQVGQYALYNVFVCGPKFITRLVVRIPPLAPKWGLIR